MKKNIIKSILIVMAGVTAISFSACQKQPAPTPSVTNPSSQTQATTEEVFTNEINLSELHSYDAESGDNFAGVWQIISGAGSKLENFKYMFDGNGKAILIVGNTGYCGTYTFDYEKSSDSTNASFTEFDEEGNPIEDDSLYDDSTETFTCQLMFGINGTYNYQFGKDEIHLTNVDSGEQTVIKRVEEFSLVPEPVKEPEIDEEILGAWKSENGEYFYFDKNGIMYNNQYGTMFTFGTYSIKEDTITSVYLMEEKETDTYTYSIEGETLLINDNKYEKI